MSCHIWRRTKRTKKMTKSGLYQWLKTLLNIKGNVKIENIFKAWNLESNGRPKRKCKQQLDITELLSINTIKLRADWRFSRYRKRCWNCNHLINSKDIIYLWDKRKQWRSKWETIFKQKQLSLYNSILELNRISKSKSKSYIDQITRQINECILELQATYFQK